jgi:hypothetical protein
MKSEDRPMSQFIPSVVLSDVMIFLIMAAVGCAITIYAFSQREYAGYALGWMGGIFVIILLSSLSPTGAPEPTLGASASEAGVSFLVIFIPGLVGLLAGFGAIAAMGISRVQSYRIARALTIAAMLCLVLATGYLMLLSSFILRLAIAVFTLGVGISVLFYSIMARYQAKPDALADTPQDYEVMATDAMPSSPTMNRVEQIRRRFRERSG